MLRSSQSASPYVLDSPQTLRKNDVPYDILVEQNEAGLLHLKGDIINYANQAFAKIFHCTPAEIMGTSILDRVAGKDRFMLKASLERLTAGTEETFSKDLQLEEGDSNSRFFSLHLKVLSNKNGIAEIIGASRDATSRVNHSIELAKTKARYEALYRNILDGIIIYNYKEEKIKDFNDAALRILGYEKREELLAINRFEFIPKSSVFFPGIDLHKETFQHGIQVMNGESFHLMGVINAKGGRQILANVNVVPTFYQHGEAYVIFQDITSQVLAEQAKAKSEKKYKEINKELKKYIDSNLQLENFAYFASHDLQTPLRSITSFTQILQRKLKGKLSDEEQEYMDFIISSSKDMRSLINDLLSYSRVNTTKINVSEFDLQLLLEGLCLELATEAIHCHSIPSIVQADRTKIRQVFQNLITNALKFIRPEVTPEIHIRCQEKEEHLLFSVQDNGIGIAEEFKEKIFMLFKRLHGSAEFEGTGIGLALVKKIIQQHEGQIWIDSVEGEGTTFWFTIKR